MKQFYEHVRIDAETLRFHVQCHICGRKQYGSGLPLICRSVKTLAKCAKGKASKFKQAMFNRAKANATQLLAIHFNQCRCCYQWVCDACYDSTAADGACLNCSQKE